MPSSTQFNKGLGTFLQLSNLILYMLLLFSSELISRLLAFFY